MKITDQAFETLLEAWKAEDFETCKDRLIFICETIPANELENLLLTNIQAAMGVFELFVKTGLDNALDDTPAREFYLRIVRYILDNETPEIKQAFKETFKHCFPGMQPVGFNENGGRLYSLTDLADGLGVNIEELLSEAQKMPDVDLIQIENSPKGTTVH
ncbi:MAG: hypothetical protein HOJ48_16330 [Desulfobacula sp.]|nr:hypothetical protein [Desulfobacula sp.]